MAEAITVEALLARIEAEWRRLQAALDSLSAEQSTVKADPAGWTVKDHTMHLAAWEDNLLALLDGRSRPAALGVTQEMWDSAWRGTDEHGWDRINGVIQARYRDLPLDEVWRRLRETHARVVTRVSQMTDADLQRPYRHFQPESDLEKSVSHWIIISTYEHFDEHLDYMRRIADSD